MVGDLDFTSLVVLKTKEGERKALEEAKNAETAGMRICLELTDRQDPMPRKWAELVAKQRLSGTTFLVDATRLEQVSPNQFEGPLGYASDQVIKQMGLLQRCPFIPVVPLNAREEHIPEAAALREEHDSLIGVRIQVAEQHPQEAVELLQRRMKQLRVEPDMVALLLDTEYLASEEVQQRRAAQCAALLAETARLPFESTTLLGSSIPPGNKRSQLKPGNLIRHELRLWRQFKKTNPALHYGDYGVVHPVPAEPPAQVGGGKFNPYLFYTAGERSHFSLRKLDRDPRTGKVLDSEDPAEHFQDLAEEVINSDYYQQHSTDSWGDECLQKCAKGNERAGSPAKWIAIGTSHHLAHLSRKTG